MSTRSAERGWQLDAAWVPQGRPPSHLWQHIIEAGIDEGEAVPCIAPPLLVRCIHVVCLHLHPQPRSHLKLVLPMQARLL